ncbi:MAG: MBL fold metallo-hydrolase, partial [Gemmatimonadota bacterium]
PQGRYRNERSRVRPSFREAFREWRATKAPTKPTDPVPTETRRRGDFAEPPASGLRVTWLGHATSIVEIGGRRILIDPMWAQRASPVSFIGPKRFHEPPLPLEELPAPDAVLLSHDHYDHLDRSTVRALGRTGVRFITPVGVGKRIVGWGVPADKVQEMEWWDQVDVGGVTVTATPSRHFSGRSPFFFDRDRALWCGFALTGPEHRVYYAGDTAMFDGFDEIGRRLGPFDASLIEIGAYNQLWADVHLGPEQAVEAFHRVKGGLFIPIHWATFDLSTHGWTEPVERFLVAARRTDARHVVPRPGACIEPARPPEVERWWPELPWRTADEYPVVSSGATTLKQSTTNSSI